MTGPSLYRRILGERFERLPPVLRRFHDQPGGGSASGILDITRGRGDLREGLASALGMPTAGRDVPVRLRVVVEGDRERWVREFAGLPMATVQWAEGGVLMEALGPTSFASDLVVDEAGLHYVFRRAWHGGVPFPRWFSPKVEGDVFPVGDGWRIDIRVAAPWLGPILRYEGTLRPEWPESTAK